MAHETISIGLSLSRGTLGVSLYCFLLSLFFFLVASPYGAAIFWLVQMGCIQNTHYQAILGAQDAGHPVASLESFYKWLTVNVWRSISLCWMKWLTGIWANLSPLAYLWQKFQFFSDKAHTSGVLMKQGHSTESTELLAALLGHVMGC